MHTFHLNPPLHSNNKHFVPTDVHNLFLKTNIYSNKIELVGNWPRKSKTKLLQTLKA